MRVSIFVGIFMFSASRRIVEAVLRVPSPLIAIFWTVRLQVPIKDLRYFISYAYFFVGDIMWWDLNVLRTVSTAIWLFFLRKLKSHYHSGNLSFEDFCVFIGTMECFEGSSLK